MDSAWEKIDNGYKRRLISLYFERRVNALLKKPLFSIAVVFAMAIIFQITTNLLESELFSQIIARYPKIPRVFYLSNIVLILGYNIVAYYKMRAGSLEKNFCLYYLRGYYNNYHYPILQEEEEDLEKFQTYITNEYNTRFEMYKNALVKIKERRS